MNNTITGFQAIKINSFIPEDNFENVDASVYPELIKATKSAKNVILSVNGVSRIISEADVSAWSYQGVDTVSVNLGIYPEWDDVTETQILVQKTIIAQSDGVTYIANNNIISGGGGTTGGVIRKDLTDFTYDGDHGYFTHTLTGEEALEFDEVTLNPDSALRVLAEITLSDETTYINFIAPGLSGGVSYGIWSLTTGLTQGKTYLYMLQILITYTEGVATGGTVYITPYELT